MNLDYNCKIKDKEKLYGWGEDKFGCLGTLQNKEDYTKKPKSIKKQLFEKYLMNDEFNEYFIRYHNI
jgi:hypothetical protein